MRGREGEEDGEERPCARPLDCGGKAQRQPAGQQRRATSLCAIAPRSHQRGEHQHRLEDVEHGQAGEAKPEEVQREQARSQERDLM